MNFVTIMVFAPTARPWREQIAFIVSKLFTKENNG